MDVRTVCEGLQRVIVLDGREHSTGKRHYLLLASRVSVQNDSDRNFAAFHHYFNVVNKVVDSCCGGNLLRKADFYKFGRFVNISLTVEGDLRLI